MIEHLEDIISSLPFQQSELFEAQSCYPGFLSWNNFWKKSFMRENIPNLDALANIHIYYQTYFMQNLALTQLRNQECPPRLLGGYSGDMEEINHLYCS